MGTPIQRRAVLDKLSADVDRLRVELVDADREASELLHGEEESARANGRAMAARALLFAALERHHDEARLLLAEQCSIHGDSGAIYASCGECVSIHHLAARRVA